MPRHRAWMQPSQQTVVASAARTTNGNSSTVTGWARNGVAAKVDVTAVSGTTPSLTVTVQDSPDGTTWTTRDTFGAKTAVSNETRTLPSGLDVFQRVAWTITGTTPSFTFSVQFASSTATLQ
jgi:hypothetical protein